MSRPFSESCEQNKQVIFEIISPYLEGEVLEIGSGTGQHAVYFSALLPQVRWQTSDQAEYLDGIRAWISHSGLDLPAPITLDVTGGWPDQQYDCIFTANSFHIMNESAVASSFSGISRCLKPGGIFLVYGPFNYEGAYTSPSNERFDGWLRQRDPQSGIRDFNWISKLAAAAGLELVKDVAMPANNRTLIWQNRTL